MQKVEDIFFSGTFGGETLSLASASAVIDKYKDKNIVEYFQKIGGYLLKELTQLIDNESLKDYFGVLGHPSWSFLQIKEQQEYTSFEVRTFFEQEMFKRGVLTLGSHNISFSHSKKDIDILLKTYKIVLPLIKKHVEQKDLLENIHGDILQPLFKIR